MASDADLERELTQSSYPLSGMQLGMLFHSLRAQEPGVDLSQIVVDCPEELDPAVFAQAWQKLAERHAILRTSFQWEALEEPRQRVHRQARIPVAQRDWSALAPAEQSAQLEALMEMERQQGFEPAIAPLLRVVLIRRGDADFQILCTYHHILLDARSLVLLWEDLFALYEALRRGNEPALPVPRPYRDHIDWLQRQDWSTAEPFWREKLKGFSTPTPLIAGSAQNGARQQNLSGQAPARKSAAGVQPAVGGNGAGFQPAKPGKEPALATGSPAPLPNGGITFQNGSVGEQRIEISGSLTSALRSVAQQNGITLNSFVQGAWALLLSRYSNEEEVVFGAVRACRRSTVEGAESIAGLFINTVPVRVRVAPQMGLLPWLKGIREQWLALRQFENTPLVKIQEWSQAPAGQPLFESILNVQDPSWDAQLRAQGGPWAQRTFRMRNQPGYPLAMDIYGDGQTLIAALVYSRQRFDDETMARLLGHFQRLLEQMGTHPEQDISSLSLLPEAEIHQLLIEWNRTEADFPKDQCVHQLFEEQAARTPDSVALSGRGSQLTYRELNERANQLAHQLRGLGVAPEVLVGVCAERSLEMVLGQLAVLKAGGAYVPIDPAYPKERINFMLEDAKISVLLTEHKLVESLSPTVRLICLDNHLRCSIDPDHAVNPITLTNPKNLAYVIYTSGSTGHPKGVEVEHAGLVNLVAWHQRAYQLTPATRASQLAGPAFDASVWEIWPYLTAGASVHIPGPEIRLSPKELLQWLAKEKISICFLPTPLAEAVMDEPWPKEIALTALLTGGDRLHRPPRQSLPCPLVNHYGPTENTVVTTAGPVAPGPQRAPPSIGRPIANAQVYILDCQLQPVPIGVAGELHIGGAGLARGYLNRPELTAEKFIANPFSREQARLYKTGDRARYLPDGNIEFLGRIDQQVKIRGYRIEPGEVETLLSHAPGVRETAVVAREDPVGDARLVAYVVPGRQPAPTIEELRSLLKGKLPDYMVPSAFVILPALPLTPNGKVDRKALPNPDPEADLPEVSSEPRTATEKLLSGIWAQVLRRERVGVNQNFFHIGGHSLLATQVVSRLRSALQVELSVQDLFDCPTVAALAQRIDSGHVNNSLRHNQGGETIRNNGEIPLSFAQERLWFLEQLQPGQGFNNIPVAIRLKGELNRVALGKSLNEIVRRHEVFRVAFSNRKGQPAARLSSAGEVPLPVINLTHFQAAEREAQARQEAESEGRQPFDLSEGRLLRAKLLEIDTCDHLLLITTHHIVSDGWSMAIFYRELRRLYDAFRQGLASPLPELPIQYADFAWQQRRQLQGNILEEQLAYWKEQLKGRLPPLELPTDRPRPPVQTYRGTTHFFTLPASLAGALKKLSRREDVTLFMLLLSAFKTLLYRYSGQEDIILGSPIAGRTTAETENLIGLFLNTLVLRTDLSGDPTFRELLQRTRKVALEAYAHQDVPFEKLVEALPVERDLSRSPIFQVMFVLQDAPFQPADDAGLNWTPTPLANGAAKFDLTLFLEEQPGGLSGSVEYNTDLFDSGTILRLLGHFETLLEAIVDNPNQPLSLLPILPDAERRQLLVDWNNTRSDYASDQCVHQLFEAQVARTPEATAVVFEDEELSYRELDDRANRVAHYLQSLGVGPEVRVGLCLNRSLEMIVGLLAILKAGGCYVPLDPAYPKERLAFMLEDSQAAVLLSEEKLAARFTNPGLKVACLSTLPLSTPNPQPVTNPATPENLAYVIYTSGSTGKPKGVMVCHRHVANFFAGMDARIGAEPGVWLAVTSICFDISVLELFWTLTRGFKVVIQGEEGGFRAVDSGEAGGRKESKTRNRGRGFTLPEQLVDKEVTHLQCTPSLAGMLTQDPQARKALQSLRKLLLGGEALPASLLKQLAVSGQILNMYGPTETTVWSTTHEINETDRSIPIGRPIANTEIYILDRHLQPVPIGVPGELLIGGAGVVRGYLNRPALTAERFIPHPFSNRPGARLYRTGDLARYLPDGKIEFLGRLDHQVKLRGFRIELGEIESALCELPQVREAVVVAREFGAGDKRLAAYLVPAENTSLDVPAIRNHLKAKLPDYMVPSAFQILEQLPLTPNGKVDRKALPEPNGAAAARETSFVPLQTDVEKRIAVVWQKLLQVEQIGRHDNFFDLGGHSLLVVQAHAQLCEIFQSEFPIIELFQYPTISSLARFLNEEPKEKVSFQKIRDRARRQQGALGMQPRPLKPRGRTTETSSN